MRYTKTGFSLVEILVAIGVFSVIIISVMQIFVVSLDAEGVGKKRTQADLLTKEYLEEIKNIRADSWDNLANGRYMVENQMGNLVLTTTATGETIGGYTRYLEIEDVYRDSSGTIVETGGSLDPSTKKVAVTVSWSGVLPGQVSQFTYLTRYRENLAWEQTTEEDFNAGTLNGAAVVNDSGGEVVLGAGGGGDWCEPGDSIAAQLDLPGQAQANAVTAIEGKAFAGTGRNASGEPFMDVDVSNPPNLSIVGKLETSPQLKTTDVFGEENYAYIATEHPNREVVIIDISSSPYQEVGYFDAPGPQDANSIFVVGNVGYAVQGNKLWTFDLSSKIGSRPRLDPDGLTLIGIGNKITVKGDYAYIPIANHHDEIQIVDVSDPYNLVAKASFDPDIYNEPGSEDGIDVFVNEMQTRAYLVVNTFPTLEELFILDITNKDGPISIVGKYDSNGMNPKSVEVVPGGRAIIVGVGAEEYQVVDISDEDNPVRCGGMEVDSGINDSASVLESDGDAYTYIVTGDTSEEFRIIEGGPGGAYSAYGVFESQTKDTIYSTAFNRFYVNFDKPSQTDIKFQTAVLDPGGGDCSSATFNDSDFVGPDGTSATFFPGDDAVPLNDDGIGYENPGQCFRFRAYLSTTDFSQTPTLYDFLVNYSP